MIASVATNLSKAFAVTNTGETLPLEFAGLGLVAEAAGGAADVPVTQAPAQPRASASPSRSSCNRRSS